MPRLRSGKTNLRPVWLLRKAVSQQSKSVHAEPVLAGHKSHKDDFPLEEQFKEF